MEKPDILILGIETSCDETAAAVVARPMGAEFHGPGDIRSNIVLSQIADHAPFGGVVPEIAARAHLTALNGVVKQALDTAATSLSELDAIAVTSGPGLAGGLIVGTMTARALAAVHDKPLFTINHLEGHALTARMTHGATFPYLLLLVSGGHTQILLVKGVGDYERWATTIDDALGEAFDKTAKMLGLSYPGGPNVERAAQSGNPKAFTFPRPLSGRDTLNMSFSGLKTAVRKAAESADMESSDQIVPDICASFQAAVADVLEDRVARCLVRFEQQFGKTASLIVAGGVAANSMLRSRLQAICSDHEWKWVAPPHALCTDNAAMIAWAGAEHLAMGNENIDAGIRPRWPLDPETAARGTGEFSRAKLGKKGAKA